MRREELVRYLDELLESARFRDYCPNGLQVEGAREVGRIVAGVTACQALIDAAAERGADALLVHHGWFWRGEDGRVTGFRKTRMKTLLARDINLIAYHLPLDAHPGLGNNARLAALLGWRAEGRFGEQDIGWIGRPGSPQTLAELERNVAGALRRAPLSIGDADRRIERLAWCSGGGQGYFEQAVSLGVDAFVSGEISEPAVHLARETGVAYLGAGHHASERLGAQALADHLSAKFGLECEFIDIDNPV
ncbi:MAG: Nif3-like dinuclear metal center hexameric protein [Candidatus Accumulibacter sp.]|jgi:dinuclear metal center YbgI/SA1388 family protein|nr:Nif3-like dinuclear metal center hexameric protein [Accumulibacter sp.]